MNRNTFARFEKGSVSTCKGAKDTGQIPWNEHKDFPGVFLKNIVTGDETGGLFTCHLVRIEPNGTIGLHTHAASVELHEVVDGSGICMTECGDIAYSAGSMAVLACNSAHEIKAGREGLCLFAKFIKVPA